MPEASPVKIENISDFLPTEKEMVNYQKQQRVESEKKEVERLKETIVSSSK